MWPFKGKKYAYIIKDARGKGHVIRNVKKVICEREYLRLEGDGVDVIFNMNEIRQVRREIEAAAIRAEGTKL